MMTLHHSPLVIPLATTEGPIYKGACPECGWESNEVVFEETEALAQAYGHLASCDELWTTEPLAA